MSFGHNNENRNRKFGRQTSAMSCGDHKVYIVWLESFEDSYTFPASKLNELYAFSFIFHGICMLVS